jgi:GrpB-like predicted nucleotidyltransferase (UPF0157 family)
MKVEIVPYRESWVQEYTRLEGLLRRALGRLAVSIDHIGSTAIPGMAAKDVIDIQVGVVSLTPRSSLLEAFGALDWALRAEEWNRADRVPTGWPATPSEWAKLVFVPPTGERPSNVHVRVCGRANFRYALLFRDYLRAEALPTRAWSELKRRLAYFTEDLSGYGYVKDAATTVLMLSAEQWARRTDWKPCGAVPGGDRT